MMTNDPGASERGQGCLNDPKIYESDCSIDIEVANIARNNASNKSIEVDGAGRVVYPRNMAFDPTNYHLRNKRNNNIKIKNKPSNERSNSNSRLNKSKGKFKGISISKIKGSYLQNDSSDSQRFNSTKNSKAKSRKASLQMRMKNSNDVDISTIQQQMHGLNLDHMIKSPHFQIPRGKVQIKQQYLNRQFIQAKSGTKPKPQSKHGRVNHSMIYDQVQNLNNSMNSQ